MEPLLGTDGRTVLDIKRAVINHAASGNNTIVSAVTGKKIRVLSLFFLAAGQVTVRIRSGASTNLTGVMHVDSRGGMALGFNPIGWVETAAGEALVFELGSAVSIDGAIQYIEI